jgi:hypothetical protein
MVARVVGLNLIVTALYVPLATVTLHGQSEEPTTETKTLLESLYSLNDVESLGLFLDSAFAKNYGAGFDVDGPTIDAPLTHSQTRVFFPSGAFSVASAMMNERHPAPPATTLRGQGVTRTLLLLGGLTCQGTLNGFMLEECTAYTAGAYLFDARTAPAVIRMRNVRVLGFDSGAGSSTVFKLVKGGVLDVRACRFEAGYGPQPAYGTLVDIRSADFFALFEECVFRDLSLTLNRVPTGGRMIFDHCVFEMPEDPREDPELGDHITFQDCRFEQRRPQQQRRAISTAFPAYDSIVATWSDR